MKNQNEQSQTGTKQDHTKEILIIIGVALLLIVALCFAVVGGAVISIAQVMSQLEGIS